MIPLITIDGPSASGKGTVAQVVAKALGVHHLDSGALYRLVAYQALDQKIPLDNEPALASLAAQLSVYFTDREVWLAGYEVSKAIREEACSEAASKIAVWPAVRAALYARQRDFWRAPGLVADGRDMGTVVFLEAILKVVLTASPQARARRRQLQLLEQGSSVSIAPLLQDILQRDERDSRRTVAPLIPHPEAIVIDTTQKTSDEVIALILKHFSERPAT